MKTPCRPRGVPLALMLSLAACVAGQPHPKSAAGRPAPARAEVKVETADPIADWRSVILAEDKARLDAVDSDWTQALAEAKAAGYTRAIAAEGPLLDPKGALPRAAPPPGSYQCRVIKLGHPDGARRGLDFIAYKPFFCHVEAEADRLWIAKQTGSQRPAGRIWAERDDRMIFLGAMQLATEKAPPAYGDAPDRNMAGYVERVDAFRWRLVVPRPRAESRLDVFELLPISPPTNPQ